MELEEAVLGRCTEVNPDETCNNHRGGKLWSTDWSNCCTKGQDVWNTPQHKQHELLDRG